ncbi:hypothetical protein ACHAXT_000354 [Thalassiosira profunda]
MPLSNSLKMADYDYGEGDDDSASHTLHHRGPQHRDNGAVPPSRDTDLSFDPCTGRACLEACQAVSSVEHTMCGGALEFDRLSSYFKREEASGEDPQSPYLYNPAAPIGPTSCEYCGRRNTKDCTSNLPEDYVLFMGNGLDRSQNSRGKSGDNATNDSGDDATTGNDSNARERDICPRPKLFFLKKRPPFATPDGWNPVTEYRTNLFEPPRSTRGQGAVRGRLGAAGGGKGDANRSYAHSGCGSSACGGGTEISFSSGGGEQRAPHSEGARSLSPVQWVSGLVGALSPS